MQQPGVLFFIKTVLFHIAPFIIPLVLVFDCVLVLDCTVFLLLGYVPDSAQSTYQRRT